MRASVRVFTLSNMNISESNGSIATKFYLKLHLGGGLAALGFGPDQIRTLVSMAGGGATGQNLLHLKQIGFLCKSF